MRSLRPIRGNPWPHDMVISVDDAAEALMQLLWVREAWALTPARDLPPLLTDTPERVSGVAPDEWSEAWPSLWRECLTHTAQGDDQSLIDEAMDPNLRPERRAEILAQLANPSWGQRFGAESLGDEYADWQRTHVERLVANLRARVQPERASLDALVPAWRSGLTHVVAIPCRGTFTRPIAPHALLVTSETRDDPERYSAALAEFAAR